MPLSRHSVGTYQGNELTCNRSGSTRARSPQLAEPLWTDPGLKSGISVRELISTKNKMCKKTFSQNPRTRQKKPPVPPNVQNSTRARSLGFSTVCCCFCTFVVLMRLGLGLGLALSLTLSSCVQLYAFDTAYHSSRDGNLSGLGMSHATTASPKFILQGTSVGGRHRGRQRKTGHPCPCRNCPQVSPAENKKQKTKQKTGRGSLMNRPSCPHDDPIGRGTELN